MDLHASMNVHNRNSVSDTASYAASVRYSVARATAACRAAWVSSLTLGFRHYISRDRHCRSMFRLK